MVLWPMKIVSYPMICFYWSTQNMHVQLNQFLTIPIIACNDLIIKNIFIFLINTVTKKIFNSWWDEDPNNAVIVKEKSFFNRYKIQPLSQILNLTSWKTIVWKNWWIYRLQLLCSDELNYAQTSCLEFKAVIVLPTITHNYSNYLYGKYVGNALVGKVIT